MRLRGAVALALLYAFCLLMPTAAFALSDAANAAHCLTETHGMAAKLHKHDAGTHLHGDGTTHKHATADDTASTPAADDTAPPGKCCGLFCIAAITPNIQVALDIPVPAMSYAALADAFSGRNPERIIKPPIA